MGSRGRGSRGPVIEDDDDDEGFGSGAKWIPPSQRTNATKAELEDEMLQKNDELTDATLGLKRLTEQTKGVAGQTLVTLKEQGEQIDRIHHKTVQTEQELQKGEKLLSKLGGLFSLGYKPKKGKAVTGPKDYGDDKKGKEDARSREALGLEKKKKKKSAGSRPNTEGMDAMQKYEADKKYQDEVLDDVIDNLDDLKMMAQEMSGEMDRQDKKLDDLNEDVKEVDNRVRQANKRANKLLGKR